DSLLAGTVPSGDSLPFEAIRNAVSGMGRGAAAVVLSDFMAPPDRLAGAARLLSSFRGKAWAFQCLDRAELELPWAGYAVFRDMETGEDVALAPDAARAEYSGEFGLWMRRTERFFSASGVRVFSAFTDVPPLTALEKMIKAF
ncbi:MAG TPA: hypothetical protein PL037_09035, partial [Elusimicrobiales bacterium]|nr:hypothetical protein [Elusimicrobiales bacterium]